MRHFRHEYILLAAFVVSIATWFSLRGQSYSVDGTLSACFTVLVFAYAIRKRGWLLIRGDEARSLPETLFAHMVCLATLILVLRTGMFASTMPDWLIIPVAADHYGRMGPSTFQMLQALAVFSLGYFEWRLLVSPRMVNVEKEERKARIALWKKAELEAERMDGLRFH